MASQTQISAEAKQEIRKGANMLRVLFVLLPLITLYDTPQFEESIYSRARGLEGSVD